MTMMAVLQTGFRPFFLVAALAAVVEIPLWVLRLTGVLPPVSVAWHAHEMVFGFSAAVIAGFLLTAVRHWTQHSTASGLPLLALVLCWLLGRVNDTADLFFLPILAVCVARPIVLARQWRQLLIVLALVALCAANAVFHAFPQHARAAWLVGVDLVLLLIVIIGGRVIPFFTRSALPNAKLRSWRWLEIASVASMAGVLAADISGRLLSLTCLIAAVVHAARLTGWASLRTRHAPLLWVLHVGYLCLPLGLLLRGLATMGVLLPESAAIHLLTTGCIGLLILGMMARVSLGHTARPLVAPTPLVWAFGLLAAAAVVRAFGPLALPASWTYALAATCWAAAFLLFIVRYAAWLVMPRLDGRPG